MRNLFVLFLFVSFFLTSCNKEYHEDDLSKIINITINQFSSETMLSNEFAPRIERNISDKLFFKNMIEFSKGEIDKSFFLTNKDVEFMLKNKVQLIQEKKISDYIDCNDRCVNAELLFNEINSFLKITCPYVSLSNDFAIVGYNNYNKFSHSSGFFFLTKKDHSWIILRKNESSIP